MTVYLVGAGPGDPGLLTRRGAELLARADVVVYDRLVGDALLDLAPPTAERIDVGKRPGDTAHQQAINDLLVEQGRTGRCVVRLKGGDPFVFGRGAEEAEVLAAAGIPHEVVPGVSSALAAPAAAGIPVTHRGLASSVTIVTGHPSAAGGPDWEALARVGGTLVVLMGVSDRARIAERLLADGRPPDTPVAVVRWGTTPRQETARTTLDRLGDLDVGPPATIVVGAVAALDVGRGDPGPLHGTSIVVTRAADQADTLVRALADAGAAVVAFPVVAVTDPDDGGTALRQASAGIGRYRWVVFTSANAVDRFAATIRDGRDVAGCKLAAVGAATAAALLRHRLVADLVGSGTAADLAASMPAPDAPGERVLYPRAAEARPDLAAGLRGRGWDVDEVIAYRTERVAAAVAGSILDTVADADWVTFTSPSSVRGYLDATAGRPTPPLVACIGPVTADAARAAGLPVAVVAADHSANGLVASIVAHHAASATQPASRRPADRTHPPPA